MRRQLGRVAVISWCVSLAKVFAAQGGAADPRLADGSEALRRVAQLEQQGRYGEAAALAQRALAAAERVLGKEHPALVDALLPLARAEAAQGRRSRAERLLLRALHLAGLGLGVRHPLCAAVLEQMAASYQARGWLRQAEPLRRRAVEIRRDAQGEHHQDLADSLTDLAILRAARGDLADAALLFQSALEISEWRLRREALGAPGAQLDGMLRVLRDRDDRLYSLVRRHADHPELARLALVTALLRKGRSAEEAAGVARAIARDLGERDREAFEQLRRLRSELASAPSPEREAELAERGDALEGELASRSAPLRAMRSLPLPGEVVDAVRRALPADGALVEWVEYEDRAPGSKRQARYLALVLTPAGGVRAVDLGPAAAVDAAASRLDRALSAAGAPYLEESRALHALVVRPWWPLVAGTRRLYLAPDARLGLVSFAALGGGRRFLADEREIAYLTSGRDLLPPQGEVAQRPSVVVFADPDFGGGAAVASAGERGVAPARQCVDLSKAAWPLLPGTRREAEAIRRLFPEAEVKLGAQATKEALLEVRAPRVLHIATHGISGELFPRGRQARGMVELGSLAAPAAAPCPEDPLRWSGPVLARPGELDGNGGRGGGSIATALELMGLDLWGTQLVVLSACASGRGATSPSEGVLGMRRAFRVAGAETLVTSLWPVDDETTAALMEAFYRHLGEGHGRAAALREAALEVRAHHPHPHFWAPFIAIGQDGPLRSGGNRGSDEIR